jgi:hypothetical protein
MKPTSKPKKHGLLIDLDCLFDTRYTILNEMDPVAADDLLLKGYYLRDRDEFPNMVLPEFREKYQKRDVNTLKNSLPTALLFRLGAIVGDYIVEFGKEGRLLNPELILNIYPYKLTPEEINTMVLCLKIHTNHMLPVRVINNNPLSITPAWLQDNVTFFYLYNWSEWITQHTATLASNRLDDVCLVAPSIMPLSIDEGREQVKELEKDLRNQFSSYVEVTEELSDMDFFKATASLIKFFIGLEFLETRDFCIAIPDEAEVPNVKFDYDQSRSIIT